MSNKKLKQLKNKSSGRVKAPQPTSKNYDNYKPVFSFRHIQYCGSHCISRLEKADQLLILTKLLQLSQFVWKDIIIKPHEGIGCEKIPHFRFNSKLPSFITDDVSILVFRYSDSGRIVGFRIKDAFNIFMVGENLYSH